MRPPRARHTRCGCWNEPRRAVSPRDVVERLANDPSRLVRVHLVKALAERDDWSTSADLFTLVRAKLKDADPFVRRAAADALGRHPAAENVEPLLALWAETPADDTHLIHTVRIALRDQLLPAGSYGPLAALLTAKPEHAAKLADVSLGVRNAESAAYLLSFAETHALDDAPLAEYLHDAVRYATDEQFADAMRRAQAVAAGSYARQQSGTAVARQGSAGTRQAGACNPPAIGPARVATVLLAQPGSAECRSRNRACAAIARGVRVRCAGRVGRSRIETARGARRSPRRLCRRSTAAVPLPIARTILTDATEGMPMRQKAATVLAAMNLPDARAALGRTVKGRARSPGH